MAVLLLENFETPGYENSWSETIGAGNSIDDSFSTVTPPEGTYSLQSVLSGTNAASYTDHTLGSVETTCFATAFLYVDSGSSTADTGQMTVVSMRGAVDNVRVQLRYTATRGWHLFFKFYNSGQQSLAGMQGDVNDNLQITTDTWYRVGISYSSVTDEIGGILWDAAGTEIDSATFTLTNARTDSQIIRIGNVDARTAATELLFDYVQADDAEWPSLPSSGTTYNVSITDTASPTDSLSASLTFNLLSSDTASATESFSGLIDYLASLSDTATPTDIYSSGASIIDVGVSETASPTDVYSGAYIFGVSLSDNATPSDIFDSIASYGVDVSELSAAFDSFTSGELLDGLMYVTISGVRANIEVTAVSGMINITAVRPGIDVTGEGSE